MRRLEMKTLPGFAEWVDEGNAKGFVQELAEMVESELTGVKVPDNQPHLSHINYGVEMAAKAAKILIRDPLGRKVTVEKQAPPARYGVRQNPAESE